MQEIIGTSSGGGVERVDTNAKVRPFHIARILYERTDAEHPLSTVQLIDILQKEYGIPSHRTTITADVELLQGLGMDIGVIRSTQNRYYLKSRLLDVGELRVLIDAVEAAKFIPKSQSVSLVKKLSSLGGNAEETDLARHVTVERRLKGSNRKMVAIVNAINHAIHHKKVISFQYYSFNEKKQKVLRLDGYHYRLSPYRLVWNGDYYYVVGYYKSHKNESVTSFRVDRIYDVPEEIDAEFIPLPAGFDLDRHLNTMYHMFSTDRKNVTLLCENRMMDAIVDRFGEKVATEVADPEHFAAHVEVAVNNVFFSWIFGFLGKVVIASPDDVREDYEKMVGKAYGLIRNALPTEKPDKGPEGKV